MPEQSKQLNKIVAILTIVVLVGGAFFGAVKFAYNAGVNVTQIKNDSEKIEANRLRTDRVVSHADEKAKMRDEISHLKMTLEFKEANYQQDLKEAFEDVEEWKQKYLECKD